MANPIFCPHSFLSHCAHATHADERACKPRAASAAAAVVGGAGFRSVWWVVFVCKTVPKNRASRCSCRGSSSSSSHFVFSRYWRIFYGEHARVFQKARARVIAHTCARGARAHALSAQPWCARATRFGRSSQNSNESELRPVKWVGKKATVCCLFFCPQAVFPSASTHTPTA